MKMKIFFIWLYVMIGINAFSQEWKLIGTMKNGDEYFIKKHTNEEGSTKVWLKLVSKHIEYKKNGRKRKKEGSSLTLYDTNCTERRLIVESIIYYDAEGNVLDSNEFAIFSSNWKNVIPDSMGELFLNSACEIL